jgi:hypothetical protein
MGKKEMALIYDLLHLPQGSWAFRNQIDAVDDLLSNGEVPRAAVFGQFENGYSGLLVSTDSRLISYTKPNFLSRAEVVDTPFDRIRAIDHKIGFVYVEITIYFFAGGRLYVKNIIKQPAIEFVRKRIGIDAVQQLESRGEHSSLTSFGLTQESAKPTSVADELAKLVKLRDDGVLTEAEFLEAKRKLLR